MTDTNTTKYDVLINSKWYDETKYGMCSFISNPYSIF